MIRIRIIADMDLEGGRLAALVTTHGVVCHLDSGGGWGCPAIRSGVLCGYGCTQDPGFGLKLWLGVEVGFNRRIRNWKVRGLGIGNWKGYGI